jgi:hypothetical protein
MITVASPDAVNKALNCRRFAVAGRPGQQQPALDAQSFRVEHFAVADGCGNEIEFRPGLLVRNDVVPGSFRHARAHCAQIAVDEYNAILERIRFLQEAADKGNDGRFVRLAVDEPDTVAQLVQPRILLHNQHKLTVAARHRAAEDRARPDHLQLAIDIKRHLIPALGGSDSWSAELLCDSFVAGRIDSGGRR